MKKQNKIATIMLSLLMTVCAILSISQYKSDAPVTVRAVGGEKSWFYLSDFEPASASEVQPAVTSGSDSANMLGIDGGVTSAVSELWLSEEDARSDEYAGNRTVFAKKYDKGLSIYAPGRIIYDITDMNASRFTCFYGANAKYSGGNGSVGIKIYTDLNADGEYLYCLNSVDDGERLNEPYPLEQYGKRATIDVAIPAGAKYLYLEATDGGNGNDGDHAVFADAKLYADYVNLSDLGAESVSTGWGSPKYDSSVNGNITMRTMYKAQYDNNNYIAREIICTKGLCLHGTSSITYNIEGMGIKRFTSFYGISSDAGEYYPTSLFRVYFDGNLVYSGYKTKGQVNIGRGVNVDLKVPEGTKKIMLTAQATGSNDGNHTTWAYPRFYGEQLSAVTGLKVALSNEALTAGERADVSVYSINLKNEFNLLGEEDISLQSSDGNVIAVEGNSLVAKQAGESQITITYLPTGIEKTTTVRVFDDSNCCIVTSPDKKSEIRVTIKDGKIYYTAIRDGKVYVNSSQMGLVTSIGDYTQGMKFEGSNEVKEIDETYDMPTGKYSTYKNHCYEQTLTFSNANTPVEMQIIVRAYDDGVAFRYVIPYDKAFEIRDELTQMNIPLSTYCWYQPNTTGEYPNTHEQLFMSGELGDYNMDFTLPFMYKTQSDVSVVVSEADLDGTYCGTILKSESRETLRFTYPEQQLNSAFSGNSNIVQSGEFYSPWRAFIAGTQKTIFESTMIENLSDESVIEDTSWVTPGVTAWSWMSGVNSGGNPFDYQGQKRVMLDYIDLAHEMGWQYYILDEGWMKRISNDDARKQGLTGGRNWLPNGGWYVGIYDFMPEVVEYANSKNVGLIAWIHVAQINDPSNDYKQMDDLLKLFSDLGIKGVKADFFNSENQKTIQLYNALYKKLAKYKLLGNMHGSNKPTGERRTYPNIINREAIYGEELNNTKASQMVIQSYVRGVVGPTDLTPYAYPTGRADTTMGHQFALGAVFESGMTCFASTIDVYRGLNEELKQYFYAYPTSWNNSLFLSGDIGSSMTVARQSRDGRWYVGGITTKEKSETVVLDFLDENVNYTAYVYTDNGKTNVNYRQLSVVKGDRIDVNMQVNGGFAIKIVKAQAKLNFVNDDSVASVSVTAEGGESITDVLPKAGTVMTFSAQCKGGYSVVCALVNGVRYNVSRNSLVLMSTGGDMNVEFVYKSMTQTAVDLGCNGSVSLQAEGRYLSLFDAVTTGEEIVLTAKPARGYKVAYVKVDGTEIALANGKYTFVAQNASMNIEVTFIKA